MLAQTVSFASDSFSQQHTNCDFSHQSKEDVLASYSRGCASQPFIREVVCDSLKNSRGNTLIDTGSQVSLVTAESLIRGLNIDKHVLKIHGITGNVMETKGCVDLSIGGTTPYKFVVVEKHPLDCAVLLGQDWLECFGCRLHIPSVRVDIILPAYSETLVRIPTTEKRSRLVQAQELQENIFCASSIVECVNSSFICLIINCNSTDESLRNFAQTQEFSKLSGEFSDTRDWET